MASETPRERKRDPHPRGRSWSNREQDNLGIEKKESRGNSDARMAEGAFKKGRGPAMER